jgi:hypothetical protein
MTQDSILRRDDNSLLFRVVEIGHWTLIVNVSDSSITDQVKWYGNNSAGKPAYVSQQQGHSYVQIK